jgi:hypothetical protein
MKTKAVFWDVTPCGFRMNRHFELLATARVLPSSLIRFILIMELIRSSETSVLIQATRRHIAEGDALHSRCRENLKSYKGLTGWTL